MVVSLCSRIIMITVVLYLCLRDVGKRSIEKYELTLNLEFYSQATWGYLILVPALDTVFSLSLLSGTHPLLGVSGVPLG